MALTIVATVGSASANSYATEAECSAVADELLRPPMGWDRADGDRRARAMVRALRILDSCFDFPGDRVDATQALEWPRYPVPTPSGLTTYDSTEIPSPLKTAQARLAFYLLDQDNAGVDPFAPTEGGDLRSIDLGNELSMTFEPGTAQVSAGARFLASVIRLILGDLCYAAQPRIV